MPDLLDKPSPLSKAELAAARFSSRIPELLSPAGDWEAMRAAVANGADAVFFGLDNFNARHRATNFKRGELPEIVKYLHAHNVKGFLTLNTLLFSEELAEAQEYIKDVARSGIDAVIVQDLGLCRLIRALAPGLHIHASTQMTLTEPRGVEWVRKLGVTRAVLGRELSIDEIRKTALALAERETATGLVMPDLEVFIHGALCVSYSGQCLTSESLGGRSANRGQCAQACRLPYDLLVDGEVRDTGEKAYLLSPQDLAGYDLVGELGKAGVACLKIEGRLKAAHYVAATTQTYRAAIESAKADQKFVINLQQKADLEQTFSRGFTHGFLSGVNHQELVHARFPKARGRRMGVVQSISAKGVIVAVEPSLCGQAATLLKAGDGVVFDEGHPEQDEQGGRLYGVRLLQGSNAKRAALELEFWRGDLNLKAVSPGAIVWKTDDPTLKKRLEHSFARDVVARRIPLRAELVAKVGETLKLTMADELSSSSATWEEKKLEAASKHPATAESLREQLGRLGDTPYELSELKAELSGGPMIPKSVLNELRRQCVEKLMARREAVRPIEVVEEDALTRLREEARKVNAGGQDVPATLNVLVRDLAQLEAVIAWRDGSGESVGQGEIKLGMVYADFEDVRGYKRAVELARGAGIEIGLATVRVIKPREEGFTRFILDCKPDALLVRNLASLAVAKELAPEIPLIGDYALNVSNELTAALFAEEGVVRMVPSYDLNWKQLGAMMSRVDPQLFECVVHQHMPMFHMEHCVFSHMLSNGTDYRSCGRPCEQHRVELKDRMGQPHPLLADVGCRNTVFNAAAQSALEYIPEMRKLGVRHYRIEMLREPAAELGPILSRYAEVIAGKAEAKEVVRSLRVLSVLGPPGPTRGTLDRE